MGIRFLAITQPFLGIKETIIYRLVMGNHDLEAFLKNSIFGGKMDVAATLAPKGLGPQDPTQKLAHRVELLGKPLSQKNVFENLGPEPPPPLKLRHL